MKSETRKSRYWFAVVAIGVGLILRVSARALAKPANESWAPGAWESSDWGFRENVFIDIGMAILVFGVVLLALELHRSARDK